MKKLSEHKYNPNNIEITMDEFMLIFDDDQNVLEMLLSNIFCTCSKGQKKLIDYKPFVNELNDLILKGKCNKCNGIASRYIECGENPESALVAERIKKRKTAVNNS